MDWRAELRKEPGEPLSALALHPAPYGARLAGCLISARGADDTMPRGNRVVHFAGITNKRNRAMPRMCFGFAGFALALLAGGVNSLQPEPRADASRRAVQPGREPA